MSVWDHEGNADAIYREAGFDPSDPPGAHKLARAVGVRIRHDFRPLIGAGCYEPSRGGRPETIWVRPELSPQREAWVIYHELAERHLYGERGDEEHERACDSLAACLRAPRQAFREVVRTIGRDFGELADVFVCSQTSVALRYGETIATPIALVTPRVVYLRGDEWGWPAERALRRLARADMNVDGLERVQLTDARGRTALLAA